MVLEGVFKRKDDHEHHDENSDLVSLLTNAQRKELLFLITRATESMRIYLDASFNEPPKDLLEKKQADKEKRDKEDEELAAKLGKADTTALHNKDIDEADKEKLVDVTKETKPEKPILNIHLSELKATTLKSYDDWQNRVITRILEVEVGPKADEKAATDAHLQEQAPDVSSDIKPDPSDQQNEFYPPIETPLKHSLSSAAKPTVIHALLLLMLSLEQYDARSRSLLRLVASSLGVKHEVLLEQEKVVAVSLVKAAKTMSAEEEKKKAAESGAWGKKVKIGLGAVAGAALIGITGGLAAPLVAAGIGGVLSGIGLGATAAATYLGALAASEVLVGALFGAYGARMTGQMMERYSKEIDDFAFIPLKPKSDENRLSVTIAISGWLNDIDEVYQPWRCLSDMSEVYALRWETEALLNLGGSLASLVKNYAFKYVRNQIIARTFFATLNVALWPLKLLSFGKVIDNPFSIARIRADKAGAVLADALINKAQGERPVTLIGYSLGARLVYACCLSLAQRGKAGLVENVYLMGTPAPPGDEGWTAVRSIVSGRVVNVYSSNDYVLAFMYRSTAAQYGVAGLQEISWPEGVESYDVSEQVDGHTRYQHLVGSILEKVGGEEMVNVEIVKEDLRLARLQKEEEEKARKEGREKAGVTDDDDGHDEIEAGVEAAQTETEEKKKQRKQEVKEVNEKMGQVKINPSM